MLAWNELERESEREGTSFGVAESEARVAKLERVYDHARDRDADDEPASLADRVRALEAKSA